MRRGERNSSTKLTAETMLQIKRRTVWQVTDDRILEH